MDDVPDRIEHTVLGPTTGWADVEAVLQTAHDLGMRACIPPAYVARAAAWNEERPTPAAAGTNDATDEVTGEGTDEATGEEKREGAGEPTKGATPSGTDDVPLVTVIDFPHGQGATEARCEEARVAWEDGADELDVVVNVADLLAGDDERVAADLEEVVASVPVPVKLIVESPLLDADALHRVGRLAVEADVDFLKTATGFSDGGATVEAVEILAEYRPVKASGGVGSWEKAAAMFDAGAERIGASSGDVIVREWQEQSSTGTD